MSSESVEQARGQRSLVSEYYLGAVEADKNAAIQRAVEVTQERDRLVVALNWLLTRTKQNLHGAVVRDMDEAICHAEKLLSEDTRMPVDEEFRNPEGGPA